MHFLQTVFWLSKKLILTIYYIYFNSLNVRDHWNLLSHIYKSDLYKVFQK